MKCANPRLSVGGCAPWSSPRYKALESSKILEHFELGSHRDGWWVCGSETWTSDWKAQQRIQLLKSSLSIHTVYQTQSKSLSKLGPYSNFIFCQKEKRVIEADAKKIPLTFQIAALSVRTIWKPFGRYRNCPESVENIRTVMKLSGQCIILWTLLYGNKLSCQEKFGFFRLSI